jgi:hypothetical protein
MSQYGDGEYCPVWTESSPVARKEHRCHACGETIRVGDRYRYIFSVFDGDGNTTKRCVRCQAIFEHLSSRMKDDQDEYCNDRLACGHGYRERWEEDPPPEIAALAFWLPGDPVPAVKP